jgi:hypothetical protein
MTWYYDCTVEGLWAVNETANVWVMLMQNGQFFGGVQWRKIAPDHFDQVINMLTIFNNVKTNRSTCNVRVDGNGFIQEVYGW